MACTKSLSLNPISEGDLSLEQAIYSSTHDAIYGVRGGWVHKFNATTGALITSAVFSSDAIGPASITEIGGVIYVCSWWTNKLPEIAAFRDNHDIFSIDPTTLAATNTHIWKTYTSSNVNPNWAYGPFQITTDGTRIVGLLGQGFNAFQPFYVDPSVPLGLKYSGSVSTRYGGGPAGGELIWDSANGVAVFSYQDGPAITSYDMSSGSPSIVDDTSGSFTKKVVGLCYCPDTDKYYAVDNTSILVTLEALDFTAIGSINTGEATANPRRIKFNPNTGYLYVPGWASNSVIVIDPVLETVVETQTDFNQPWDVVITPTKMFAVQNAPIGLREIT